MASEKSQLDIASFLGKLHNVILFKDAVHTDVEMFNQIKKAIHCTDVKAHAIVDEVEKAGKAIVITSNLERCEHVEAVLALIKLSTKIEVA